MSLESYAHKAAKEICAGWLREISAACYDDGGFAHFDKFVWRVNREGPSWGIWTEYPICPNPHGVWGDLEGTAERLGAVPVWDEYSDKWESKPPTYDELVLCGTPPEYILDIAVQHKGGIIAGIEIVHKNEPSPSKLMGLQFCGLSTIAVIPAMWILSQVKRPEKVPLEFYPFEW